MSLVFFTTDDGDIILRAGTEPDSKRDFRVHKLILSLASPVFKDMFAFPQPPDQNPNEEHQPPVVDVLDPPEALDILLQFIYPGVEPPKITEPPTLSALLSIADKYDVTSIYPILREVLKTFLPLHSLWVYIIACRFEFSEEAKEAANRTKTGDFLHLAYHEDLPHISSTDLFQLVQFVQEREHKGRRKIRGLLDPMQLENPPSCEHHGEDAQNHYFRLEKEVEDAFAASPCLEAKDLFAILDRVPDPPPGCEPHPKPAGWYYEGGDEDAFNCPVQPMTVRRRLAEVVEELDHDNRTMLQKYFGKGAGSG